MTPSNKVSLQLTDKLRKVLDKLRKKRDKSELTRAMQQKGGFTLLFLFN